MKTKRAKLGRCGLTKGFGSSAEEHVKRAGAAIRAAQQRVNRASGMPCGSRERFSLSLEAYVDGRLAVEHLKSGGTRNAPVNEAAERVTYEAAALLSDCAPTGSSTPTRGRPKLTLIRGGMGRARRRRRS